MQLVTKKLAKTFKPGMMFRNSNTPENQLCFMTDISVKSDCVHINGRTYRFNRLDSAIETYDKVPVTDADGRSLVPGKSTRYVIDGEPCELADMKQWYMAEWLFDETTTLREIVSAAKDYAKLYRRYEDRGACCDIPCTAIRQVKVKKIRVLLAYRNDDGEIETMMAHPLQLTNEPNRWNPLAIERDFLERTCPMHPLEQIMEWQAACERINTVEHRAKRPSRARKIAFTELVPEAQTAVRKTLGLTTEKEKLA